MLFGALNPIISGSTTAPEPGVEEKAVFSSQPSSKVKSCVIVEAGAACTENTDCLTLVTGLDTSLTAAEMDTPHFAPSLRRE